MSSRAAMPARTRSSSTPAAFSTAPRRNRLQAIGAAMSENGRVIVTGCMGAEPDAIREAFPNVSAITGPQAFESVMAAVHDAAPAPHDPFVDLIPEQGVKLTPRHYAYLKICRGLPQPLLVLHHPKAARRSCVAARGRGAARSGKAGQGRRQGASRHFAGHQRLRPRSEVRREPLARPRCRRALSRSDARTWRARRLGAAALCLPLSACR